MRDLASRFEIGLKKKGRKKEMGRVSFDENGPEGLRETGGTGGENENEEKSKDFIKDRESLPRKAKNWGKRKRGLEGSVVIRVENRRESKS